MPTNDQEMLPLFVAYRIEGRNQEPERIGAHKKVNPQEHPGGQWAKSQPGEQAAHGAERDVSSY